MIKLNKTLYGASLVALAFSLNTTNVNAQTCTTAPNCDTLGFTKSETACKDRTSLKCPFDQTKYFCLTAAEEEEALGKTGDCKIGSILYSDKTCSTEVIPSKVAIGVVFDANRGLAVALEERALAWSAGSFDVPDLVNRLKDGAKGDFAGANNTATVLAYCKSIGRGCPAFEYVGSYKTQGTNTGDWYLPAFGELNELYLSREAVNVTLEKISSTRLDTSSGSRYLSSSENDYYAYSWAQKFDIGDIYLNSKTSESGLVRPVLAF